MDNIEKAGDDLDGVGVVVAPQFEIIEDPGLG